MKMPKISRRLFWQHTDRIIIAQCNFFHVDCRFPFSGFPFFPFPFSGFPFSGSRFLVSLFPFRFSPLPSYRCPNVCQKNTRLSACQTFTNKLVIPSDALLELMLMLVSYISRSIIPKHEVYGKFPRYLDVFILFFSGH